MHKITTAVPRMFYRKHKLFIDYEYILFSMWHNLNSDVCTVNLWPRVGKCGLIMGCSLSLFKYDPNWNGRNNKVMTEKFP